MRHQMMATSVQNGKTSGGERGAKPFRNRNHVDVHGTERGVKPVCCEIDSFLGDRVDVKAGGEAFNERPV